MAFTRDLASSRGALEYTLMLAWHTLNCCLPALQLGAACASGEKTESLSPSAPPSLCWQDWEVVQLRATGLQCWQLCGQKAA